jgi:glyoxylase-like metal-dependent hydrolase (beta-lactamase superfamily II)
MIYEFFKEHPMPSARMSIATFLSATAIALMTTLLPLNVEAAAPMRTAQPAGYYTIKVGDFDVTAIYDGGGLASTELLRADAKRVRAMLARNHMDLEKIRGSISGFAVNTGSKLILIDTGTGGLQGGSNNGKFLANFTASGYQPEQVDEVLLTHLHHDHVGGIIKQDGTAVFPHAIIRMAQADSDFWLSESNAKLATSGNKEDFDVARKAAKPYLQDGRWRPFQQAETIEAGIQAIALPGHTPGHTGYQLTSNGQTLFIWGDVVNFAAVQLPSPDISVDFDQDPAQAATTRIALLRRLSKEGVLIAGPHIQFPGFGRLRKQEHGYAWLPIAYSDSVVQP